MASSNKKNQKNGRIAAIPHEVMNSIDYIELPSNAKVLLFELAKQYNLKNNGDLTLAYTVMKKRGFKSKSTLQRAIDALIQSNMIILTRTGRFTNPGGYCSLFGLTWRPIDDIPSKNLEVGPTTTPPRKFSMEKFNPPSPKTGQGSSSKQGRLRKRGKDGRWLSASE